jgi:hypothetical protein
MSATNASPSFSATVALIYEQKRDTVEVPRFSACMLREPLTRPDRHVPAASSISITCSKPAHQRELSGCRFRVAACHGKLAFLLSMMLVISFGSRSTAR